MDNLQGIRQIKAYGHQKHEDQRFADRAAALRDGTLSVMRVWANYSPAMSFSAALGSALVLWVGGALVLDGTMKIGELACLLGCVTNLVCEGAPERFFRIRATTR